MTELVRRIRRGRWTLVKVAKAIWRRGATGDAMFLRRMKALIRHVLFAQVSLMLEHDVSSALFSQFSTFMGM